jgi:hypothetical protein
MFRFTIRDVLWLMVVVAMGVAWWSDRRVLIEVQPRVAALEYWIREMGLIVKSNSSSTELYGSYDGKEFLLGKVPPTKSRNRANNVLP